MKKLYTTPAMQVNETQVQNLMAVSLSINNGVTVDGSEALSKEEDSDWDIWGE